MLLDNNRLHFWCPNLFQTVRRSNNRDNVSGFIILMNLCFPCCLYFIWFPYFSVLSFLGWGTPFGFRFCFAWEILFNKLIFIIDMSLITQLVIIQDPALIVIMAYFSTDWAFIIMWRENRKYRFLGFYMFTSLFPMAYSFVIGLSTLSPRCVSLSLSFLFECYNFGFNCSHPFIIMYRCYCLGERSNNLNSTIKNYDATWSNSIQWFRRAHWI